MNKARMTSVAEPSCRCGRRPWVFDAADTPLCWEHAPPRWTTLGDDLIGLAIEHFGYALVRCERLPGAPEIVLVRDDADEPEYGLPCFRVSELRTMLSSEPWPHPQHWGLIIEAKRALGGATVRSRGSKRKRSRRSC